MSPQSYEEILSQNRERYNLNKDRYNINRKQRDRVRITERRIWLNSLKNKPCADCGILYPPRAMDWHHINGDGLGQHKGMSMLLRKKNYQEVVLQELEKCVLLCSNCHRLRHA